MREPSGLLPEFGRKHLLHVSLATQVRDLSLGSDEWVGARSAERDLVLHQIRRLEKGILCLIRYERRFEVLLPQRIVDVHQNSILWGCGVGLRNRAEVADETGLQSGNLRR